MNNTNEWITDRLPTATDGDEEGDVCIVTGPGRDGEEDYGFIHWSYVGARAPWRHSRDWEPPDEPEHQACRLLEPAKADATEASMVNCHWYGPPPSPYTSTSDWFKKEGSKGILHGLRISALLSRGGNSEAFGPLAPALTESADSDRIAALDRRVVGHVRAQSVLVAALVKRLEALEGLASDGAIPESGRGVPGGGIVALEQRVENLETLFWAHSHPATTARCPWQQSGDRSSEPQS
jgi:hypothetical protein